MPLKIFVMILITVIAAVGLTVWLGSVIFFTFDVADAGWLLLIPVALAVFVTAARLKRR